MSEDQPQQPQPENSQPKVKQISRSQKMLKTPKSPAGNIQSQTVLRSFLDKLGSVLQTIVQFVRSRLPASVNEKLSDTVLSGAITAILIVAIGIIITILPGKSPEIAAVPSPETSDQTIITSLETSDQTIITSPETSDQTVVPSPETSDQTVVPSPETSATNLPEVVAPEETKPVEIAPPPPPKLTPEQHFIATIQKQVAEITNQFGGGLINSIQANFPSNLLAIKVADDWYSLGESEQNQLANQMFQQAQKLEFRKLEITNSKGKLIARSPVIGSDMIILERKKAEIISNS